MFFHLLLVVVVVVVLLLPISSREIFSYLTLPLYVCGRGDRCMAGQAGWLGGQAGLTKAGTVTDPLKRPTVLGYTVGV